MGNEQRIERLQARLDSLADEIDAGILEDGEDDDYVVCLRLMHAQISALVYLLKKGQTNLGFKDKLR